MPKNKHRRHRRHRRCAARNPDQHIDSLKSRLSDYRTLHASSSAEARELLELVKTLKAAEQDSEIEQARYELSKEETVRSERNIRKLEGKIAKALNACSKIENIVEQLRNYSNLYYFSLYHYTRNHIPQVQAMLVEYDKSIKSQPVKHQVDWLHNELSKLDPSEDGTVHGVLTTCTTLHAALNEHTTTTAEVGIAAIPSAAHV